jgi:hypothetical protein
MERCWGAVVLIDACTLQADEADDLYGALMNAELIIKQRGSVINEYLSQNSNSSGTMLN